MKLMKLGFVVAMAACGEGDGGVEAGTDAAPDVPACVKHFPFESSIVPNGLAIEGDVALVSAGRSVTAVPLDGRAPTTIATSTHGATATASYGGVAYYAFSRVGGTEIRRRDGTVHAVLSALNVYQLAINATDIYAVVPGVGSNQVWRVARTANPYPVSVATLPETTRMFVVGKTFGAFAADGVLYTVPLPDGGPATSHGMGERVLGVGDVAVSITGQMSIPNSLDLALDRFFPSPKSFYNATLFSETGAVYADDRYLYLGIASEPTNSVPLPPKLMIWDAATGEPATATGCAEFQPPGSTAFDATRLVGLRLTAGSGAEILVAPRAR